MTAPPLAWANALGPGDESVGLELFYAHLVLGEFERPDENLLEELFAKLNLSQPTKAYLVRQGPVRLRIYRELVRGTYRRAIEGAMPRARARMGTEFDELFSGFLATRATQSRFLRDIAWDFLDYCRAHPAADGSLPAYILELGELEAVRISVAAAPNPSTDVDLELELDRALSFSESVRVLRFQYAVHRLPESETDHSIPERLPTRLLAYRSVNHAVRYLELSELATLIIDELMAGRPLGQSVKVACSTTGQDVDEATLGGTAQLLSDLAARGVILGVVDPS